MWWGGCLSDPFERTHRDAMKKQFGRIPRHRDLPASTVQALDRALAKYIGPSVRQPDPDGVYELIHEARTDLYGFKRTIQAPLLAQDEIDSVVEYLLGKIAPHVRSWEAHLVEYHSRRMVMRALRLILPESATHLEVAAQLLRAETSREQIERQVAHLGNLTELDYRRLIEALRVLAHAFDSGESRTG
jgi:hypothetical protein